MTVHSGSPWWTSILPWVPSHVVAIGVISSVRQGLLDRQHLIGLLRVDAFAARPALGPDRPRLLLRQWVLVHREYLWIGEDLFDGRIDWFPDVKPTASRRLLLIRASQISTSSTTSVDWPRPGISDHALNPLREKKHSQVERLKLMTMSEGKCQQLSGSRPRRT